MRKQGYTIIETIPLVLAAIGSILIIVGLYGYLSPIEYMGIVNHVEHSNLAFQIAPNDISEGWGMARQDALWLDWTLNVSIRVQKDEKIDFYLLNETEYTKKQEGETFEWILCKKEVSRIELMLKPIQAVKYCFLYDNSRYSESKTVELHSIFKAVIPRFDYERAFIWGLVALVGTLLFTPSVGGILWFNRNTLDRFIKFDPFPGASRTSIWRKIKKIFFAIFWVFLIVPGIISAIRLIHYYFLISSVAWVENMPIYTDVLIRFFLAGFLVVTPLAFFYLATLLVSGAVTHAIYVRLSARDSKKRELEWKLHRSAFVFMFNIMKSKKTISLLLSFFILWVVIDSLWPNLHSALTVGFGCIASTWQACNLFKAYRKTSETLGLDPQKAVKLRREIFVTEVSLSFWILLLLVGLFAIYPSISMPIYDTVWKNCPGIQYWSDMFQGFREHLLIFVQSLWDRFASSQIWETVLPWTIFAVVFGYLLPHMVQAKTKAEKMRTLLLYITIFIAAFMAKEILGFFMLKEFKSLDFLAITFLVSVFGAIILQGLWKFVYPHRSS